MQVIEDEPKYWEVMSSALAVGWLDIVVSSFRFRFRYFGVLHSPALSDMVSSFFGVYMNN